MSVVLKSWSSNFMPSTNTLNCTGDSDCQTHFFFGHLATAIRKPKEQRSVGFERFVTSPADCFQRLLADKSRYVSTGQCQDYAGWVSWEFAWIKLLQLKVHPKLTCLAPPAVVTVALLRGLTRVCSVLPCTRRILTYLTINHFYTPEIILKTDTHHQNSATDSVKELWSRWMIFIWNNYARTRL